MNADYAGRSVFTGYRTDTTLKFTKPETRLYSITEQLDSSSVDSIRHVDIAGINNITDAIEHFEELAEHWWATYENRNAIINIKAL